MKTTSHTHRLTAFCAAIALSAFSILPASRAESAPRIDALQVAKIASDYLATHGRNAPHIVSIALETDALLGGQLSWIVRFSRAVSADGNSEVGMRVKLDGTVSYLVKDKNGSQKKRVPLKS
ncbi:MAG: hypothetical protein ABIP20_01400 [Chthoniobacteraceae bacterium]